VYSEVYVLVLEIFEWTAQIAKYIWNLLVHQITKIVFFLCPAKVTRWLRT